ncbi:MAG: response regulator [Serpentinimonas sp.]|jgi:DNA-binding response OmpR family regulator|nr:response regulator [Serpentinimonas sp.]
MPAHILVVEDQDIIRKLVRMTLEMAGHTVSEASSGRQGVDAALAQPPDLILMDVMMPGELNGLAACRALRAQPGFARIPIVMLTAKGQEQDRLEGLSAGASDYVVKPFAPQALLSLIERQLGRPAASG